MSGFQNKQFDGREKWKKLADSLEEEGFEVMIASYSIGEAMKEPLLKYAEELEIEITLIKKPDVIIAHSMGCLVTRSAVEMLSAGYPGKLKLILIEGPHQGLPGNGVFFSRAAVKIFELIKRLPDWGVPNWKSWKDMQQGSEFLHQLNDDVGTRRRGFWLRDEVSYYEIGGMLTKLFPETFSLPQEINCSGKMIFPRVSHSSLKKNPRVIDYIVKIIKDS